MKSLTASYSVFICSYIYLPRYY